MKKIILIFLFITQILVAQKSFEKANALYQKGNYEQAISEYESVLAGKQHSSELYFNLGNCYYKLNKVAPAIYNYEKALMLNPDDLETQNNLRFAQKMTIDEIKEIPKVGFTKTLHNLTSTFHYNTWAWISVVLSAVFLLFFIGYYLSQKSLYKRIFFFGMFVLFFLLFSCVFIAITEKNTFDNENPAIIFAEIVVVKSEPQRASTTTFTLHEGTKVFIVGTMEGWKKIELTDGTEGWVEKDAIKEIKVK